MQKNSYKICFQQLVKKERFYNQYLFYIKFYIILYSYVIQHDGCNKNDYVTRTNGFINGKFIIALHR